MKDIDVKKNLCYYDRRNPDCLFLHDGDDSEPDFDNCSCDNCFYGRHKLAAYILYLHHRLGELT